MRKNGLLLWLALAAACFVNGCASIKPAWEDSSIHPQPCADPSHEHFGRERPAATLRSVSMDLGRYKSPQERPGQDTNLVLAVAISGGGERSANFAIGVLLELEKLTHKQSNALKEIDYFSTVSGGGMAAGGYVSELLDYVRAHGTSEGFQFNCAFTNCCHGPGSRVEKESLKGYLKHGYHSTIMRTLLSVSDTFSQTDRGDYFERALDEYVLARTDHPRFSLTLRDIFVPRRGTNQVVAPCWIANATVLGNGAIFQFTPDVLEQYGVSHYYHDLKKTHLNCPFDLPLAVGLKASASFPVAVPSSTLQLSNRTARTFLQLSDGGMADNLGVITAMQVFQGAPVKATKVLLVVDAYTGSGLPFDAHESSPSAATMAVRAAEISLDAWRGRYRELVEDLCRQRGVQVIFLSFDELAERVRLENGGGPLACYDFVREQTAETKKPISSEEFRKSVRKLQNAVRNVPTNLQIKPKDQDLLLIAGRLVVCLHEDLIRRRLKWED